MAQYPSPPPPTRTHVLRFCKLGNYNIHDELLFTKYILIEGVGVDMDSAEINWALKVAVEAAAYPPEIWVPLTYHLPQLGPSEYGYYYPAYTPGTLLTTRIVWID